MYTTKISNEVKNIKVSTSYINAIIDHKKQNFDYDNNNSRKSKFLIIE
jgi:hypothetical protein